MRTKKAKGGSVIGDPFILANDNILEGIVYSGRIADKVRRADYQAAKPSKEVRPKGKGKR